MTYNSTRKQFFAKLLGVVGASSVLPKLGAKSASPVEEPTASKPVTGFQIRHDLRAVARRDVI